MFCLRNGCMDAVWLVCCSRAHPCIVNWSCFTDCASQACQRRHRAAQHTARSCYHMTDLCKKKKKTSTICLNIITPHCTRLMHPVVKTIQFVASVPLMMLPNPQYAHSEAGTAGLKKNNKKKKKTRSTYMTCCVFWPSHVELKQLDWCKDKKLVIIW